MTGGLPAAALTPRGDEVPAAQALVVLGCALGEDGGPRPALRRRVEQAAALFRAGCAPLLVLSGGGRRSRSEAEAMHALATALGIPESALLLEPWSRDTVGNARESARLLAARGISRVLLVSDAYHLPRARRLFARAGLDVVAVSAPPGPGFRREALLGLREALALLPSFLRMALAARRRGRGS